MERSSKVTYSKYLRLASAKFILRIEVRGTLNSLEGVQNDFVVSDRVKYGIEGNLMDEALSSAITSFIYLVVWSWCLFKVADPKRRHIKLTFLLVEGAT